MAEPLDGRIEKLRYWCQKVMPSIYDDSLSYYELLNKITNTLNQVVEVVAITSGDISEFETRLNEEMNELTGVVEGCVEDSEQAIRDSASAVEDASAARLDASTARSLVESVVYDPGNITNDCGFNSDTTKVVISSTGCIVCQQGQVVFYTIDFTPKATGYVALASSMPNIMGGAAKRVYEKAYCLDDTSDQIVCLLNGGEIGARFESSNLDNHYVVSGCYICYSGT